MDAKKDLFWAIFFLVMLGIVWYYTGGPNRPASTSGPFLYQPREYYSEELRKQTEKIVTSEGQEIEIASTTASAYRYQAKLSVSSGTKSTDPQKQYVTITASSNNDKPINITGWKLFGKIGLDIKIGQGAYLPYSARVNPQQDIFLDKGAKAVIITGESPIGTSFRLNMCTGYFSQFQTFYPTFPKQCPEPDEENLPLNLNDQCLDYLKKLPKCQMQISIPYGIQPACQTYVNDKINYSSCVDTHKNDSDFYKSEWRVYLGRKESLWKQQRETIILEDQDGKIIDWVLY